jgi:hypothetical protein
MVSPCLRDFAMKPLFALPLLLLAPMAHAAQEDSQTWAAVHGMVGLGGRAVVNFDYQARITDEHSRAGQILLRQAIGYRINPKTSVFGGYAYVRTDNLGAKVLDEHRLFQQANFSIADMGKSGAFTGRTRLEQRFVEGSGEVGWRMRQQVRASLPIGKGFALVGSAEPFFAFNKTAWGQKAGFDQLRLFGGLAVPVARGFAIETGYMGQYIARDAKADRMNHIFSLALTINR